LTIDVVHNPRLEKGLTLETGGGEMFFLRGVCANLKIPAWAEGISAAGGA